MVGLQVNSGLSWELAALIVLSLGLLVGLINGVLVTRLSIDSFIATMGVGSLLYGASNWYTGGMQIAGFSLPDGYLALSSRIVGVPAPALIVACAGFLLWVLLAWIIHEITKSFRAPFPCSESCSVGNTVCIPLLPRIRYRKRVR